MLVPCLWHGDGVKGGKEQQRQNLQTFQNQQAYKVTQRSRIAACLKFLLLSVAKLVFVPVGAVHT